MRFDDLPLEILQEIFRYIPRRDLWKKIRSVCKYFAKIVSDKRFMKTLLRTRDGIVLSECQLSNDNFNLPQCFVEVEEERMRWNGEKLLKPLTLVGHSATADALLLMRTSAHKELCISGSRDRTFLVWDLEIISDINESNGYLLNSISENSAGEKKWVASLEQAHDGWIWSACKADTDSFFSCGWDRSVKLWRITDTLSPIYQKQLSSAAFCVVDDGHFTACSTYDQKIYILDVRQSPGTEVTVLKHHQSVIFDLSQDANYLYSCSKDKRIVCVDKRTWSVTASHELKNFAQTVSLGNGELVCGDMHGKLITFDPKTLKVLEEFPVGDDTSPIRQVRLNSGSKMCVSKNRRMKVFNVGVRSKLIAESLTLNHEPSRFDYLNKNLVVACGGGSLLFWFR